MNGPVHGGAEARKAGFAHGLSLIAACCEAGIRSARELVEVLACCSPDTTTMEASELARRYMAEKALVRAVQRRQKLNGCLLMGQQDGFRGRSVVGWN